MKKAVTLLFFITFFGTASAQYCGSPDSLSCDTFVIADSVGLYPPPDSFYPLLNNFLTAATIQFRNYDTILFGTEVLPVYYLKWDTIENLPPGLCWSTNKPDNTFAPGEAGCIHIRGLACGPTGQYKLSTLVTVDIGIPVETDGDPGGLGYFVRLENFGEAIIPVDTSQTDSVPFIPYGGSCQNLTPLSVNLGPDQTVCAGSIVTFNPTVTGGQPPYTYQWQYTGNSIICPTCPDASVTVTQSSIFILKAMDASGLYGYDTVNFTATGTPYNFQISAPEPTAFCGGGIVPIAANANDSVSFQWYNGSNILAGQNGNTLTVTDTSGGYYLVFTEVGVCQATSNIINLLFYDTTSVSITSLNSDTFCVGAAVSLLANAGDPVISYTWLANHSNLSYNNPLLTADVPGFYQAVVTNAVGCNDTSTGVFLVASPNLPPTLSYTQFTSDTLCNNASVITLTGGQPVGGYYTGTGVTDSLFTPSAANAGLNFVYYNYTDSTGCGNSVFDTIDVLICTAVQSLSWDEGINLFPNPVYDRVTVQSDILMQPKLVISVYDIDGRRLPLNYTREAADKISVNTASLSAGCYWLQLSANGGQVGRCFIKQQ